ncbi:MAG TPA: hypothetical protein VFI27_15475 [candidate division Zixibacteria bacterium]|nr:hypothetical protein [candidate division Zixibacteria bacterium]
MQAIIAETGRLVPFERAAVMLVAGERLRVVAADGADQQVSNELFDLEDSAGGIV